jgi:HMG (high mobility group) box
VAGSPFESTNNQIKQGLNKQQAGNDKKMLAKIPRPPNAFILYRQEHHPFIKAANPEFHNNDICK